MPGQQFRQYVLQLQRILLVVLQGLADANYKFFAIEVGAYGKQFDEGIYSKSTLYQHLKNNSFNMR